MITTEVIQAQPRTEQQRGKNEARRVRATGRIPAVLYGAKKEAVSVAVDPKKIERILYSESGHNTIFDLQVGEEGGKEKVMIVDWQYDPLKGLLLHIDLKRIDMRQTLRVSVPIELNGTPEGVKTQGGILDQVLREVEIECLPGDIPSSFEMDVTSLVFGQVLRVSDLPHAGKVKFITPDDQAVAHITVVKEEVVATPEATAEAAAAAPAEPEVIKKGKQETAEETEAEPAKKGEASKKPEAGKK